MKTFLVSSYLQNAMIAIRIGAKLENIITLQRGLHHQNSNKMSSPSWLVTPVQVWVSSVNAFSVQVPQKVSIVKKVHST